MLPSLILPCVMRCGGVSCRLGFLLAPDPLSRSFIPLSVDVSHCQEALLTWISPLLHSVGLGMSVHPHSGRGSSSASYLLSLSPSLLTHMHCPTRQGFASSLPSLLSLMHNELSLPCLPRPLQAFHFYFYFPGCPASFGPLEKKNGVRPLPLAFALSNSTSPLPLLILPPPRTHTNYLTWPTINSPRSLALHNSYLPLNLIQFRLQLFTLFLIFLTTPESTILRFLVTFWD